MSLYPGEQGIFFFLIGLGAFAIFMAVLIAISDRKK